MILPQLCVIFISVLTPTLGLDTSQHLNTNLLTSGTSDFTTSNTTGALSCCNFFIIPNFHVLLCRFFQFGFSSCCCSWTKCLHCRTRKDSSQNIPGIFSCYVLQLLRPQVYLEGYASSSPQNCNPFGQCYISRAQARNEARGPQIIDLHFLYIHIYECYLNSVTFCVHAGNSEADLEFLRSRGWPSPIGCVWKLSCCWYLTWLC